MVDSPEIYAVTLPAKMREDLEVVYRNCEHLASMVNDVLDLTRVESGHVALHRESVSLRTIVQRAAEVVRPLLEKKRLHLHIALPNDLPEVYCDRVRIQQVLLNLLSNAARFTESGGITVTGERHGPDIRVSVADTGPGIPPEEAARIFEPFVQGSGDIWRARGGSGLGLSISKRFIDLHQGRMWVESQVGHGATFFCVLPVAPLLEPAARPGGWIRPDWVWRERSFLAARAAMTPELSRPRLVICDLADVLADELAREAEGIELVQLGDAQQAIAEVQRCPAHALLLNVAEADEMYAAIDTIQRAVPSMPVIGCSFPKAAARAQEAGALGYLIKPLRRTDIRRALAAAPGPIRRALIADDDPDARSLLARMLRVCNSGLEIVEAQSGREAVDIALRTHPDIVFLDIVMPDVDGWQVLQLLKASEEMRERPVFFVSAQDPTDRRRASPGLAAAIDGGVSPRKVVACALALSTILLNPETEADPVVE